MGIMLTGLVLLAFVVVVVSKEKCNKTAYVDDSSTYPRSPMTYDQVNEMIRRGSGGKSRPLYEVYNLQELAVPPILTRVVVNWQRLPNGSYFNDVAGWYPDYDTCYVSPLYFTRADGGSKYVKLKFNIFLPAPEEYVGTLYSSCPDRYIISWFCPFLELKGKKCYSGTRMSLLTFEETIDHLPWHLIAGDICTAKSPLLDDIRWKFTHKGEVQCGLPSEDGRRKRDAVKYISVEDTGRHLWP